jgi:hypothetical protein
MLVVESGGVLARWDPRRRILALHMRPGCAPTAHDADVIADAVEAWTGLDAPVDVIVDCEGATGAFMGWRVRWTTRLTRSRRRVRLGYHNMRGLSALIIPTFARMSGIEARHFRTAAEAEAWLREGASSVQAPAR